MKCENCGCEVHAYKEIKQAMLNEGFDREYLRNEIDAVVSAAVNSAAGDAVARLVPEMIKKKINDWMYTPTLKNAVKEVVAESLKNQIEVTVKKGIGL